MHIVFLSWWWPYPASNGSKIRLYNLLRHLAAQHQVTLLSFADEGEATAESRAHLEGFCARVEVVPKPQYNPGGVKAMLGYLSRWPRSLVDVYSAPMAKVLWEIASEHPIDVLIGSEFQTMRYLDLLPRIPAILEEFEITSFHNQVEAAGSAAGRMRAQLTLGKMENSARAQIERGIAYTVVSEAERDYVRHFAPRSQVEVIPNGVDTTHIRPDPTVKVQPHAVVYNGSVTYAPNLDAVTYFAHEVLPILRARYADASFTVTGGTGSADVNALKALPGVTFTGFVPEIAPVVQSHRAVVVPLRFGGGTRLKILEAMAQGVPVVASRKGAEGLNVQDGESILLADSPTGICDALDRLFRDDDLHARIAANARVLVEREYDWQVMGRQLLDLVEQVARKPQPT
jgi:glycosyltransferase involved in cell wall biosynthesis